MLSRTNSPNPPYSPESVPWPDAQNERPAKIRKVTKAYAARDPPAPVQAKDKKTDFRAVIVKRTVGHAKILKRAAGADTVISTMDEAVKQQKALAALVDDIHAKTQLFIEANQKVVEHTGHGDAYDLMQGSSFEEFCTVVTRATEVARGFYNKITNESANAATLQSQLDEAKKSIEKYQQLCERLRTERGECYAEGAELRRDKVDYRTERDSARKDRDRYEKQVNVMRNEMEVFGKERDGYLERIKQFEIARTQKVTIDSAAQAVGEEKLKIAEAEKSVLEGKIKNLIGDHTQNMTAAAKDFDMNVADINHSARLRWEQEVAKYREVQLGVEEKLKISEAARSGLEGKIKALGEKHVRELKQEKSNSTSKEREYRREFDKAERAQKVAREKLKVIQTESTKRLEDLRKDHMDDVKILTDGHAWDLAKEKVKSDSRTEGCRQSAIDERKVLEEDWNKRLDDAKTAHEETIRMLNDGHAQELAREISISELKDQQIKLFEGDLEREVKRRKAHYNDIQKKENEVASQAKVIRCLELQNTEQKHELQRLRTIKSRDESHLAKNSEELLAQRSEISLKNERICTLESKKSELDTLLRVQEQEMSARFDIMRRSKDDQIRELQGVIDVRSQERDQIVIAHSELVTLKDNIIREIEESKSKVDTQLEQQNDEVAAQLKTISLKDATINELASAKSRLISELKAESSVVAAKSETISSKDKEIEELKADKIIDATSLDQKIKELTSKECAIAQKSTLIETLQKEHAKEQQESLESLAALQSMMRTVNQRANSLSADLEQTKRYAASEKITLEGNAMMENERADILASDLKARERDLRQKESELISKTQRIEELRTQCKQKDEEALVGKANLEKLVGSIEATEYSLQGKIKELAQAQAQYFKAQNQSTEEAIALQTEVIASQASGKRLENQLGLVKTDLAAKEKELFGSADKQSALQTDIAQRSTLAEGFKEELEAEKAQLLADTKDIWVSKGIYEGATVTVRIYRSLEQGKAVVVLYQGDQRKLVWRGKVQDCTMEMQSFRTGLGLTGRGRSPVTWVQLIDSRIAAMRGWLAMRDTDTLDRLAKLSIEEE